jgi:hypothetical protein
VGCLRTSHNLRKSDEYGSMDLLQNLRGTSERRRASRFWGYPRGGLTLRHKFVATKQTSNKQQPNNNQTTDKAREQSRYLIK